MKTAEQRAEMPKGPNSVLDRRTMENSNRNLLSLVKDGNNVLDVGCGTGAITKDIVKLVGQNGKVKGIDSSEHLIRQAKETFSGIPNLNFEVADINTYSSYKEFDVITSARVLQWLSNPKEVLLKMKRLLKPGGAIAILDYNHQKVEFNPPIPSSMQNFYNAFLKWRKDTGIDNEIADHLKGMMEDMGLKNITVDDQSEISTPDKASFFDEIEIWKKVAELRGPQLAVDGYITETERLQAISDYEDWMKNDARYMKLYLLAVTGYK
jgi:ubiquinone/menaquinone biosynthesis C-methylase UbiE